MHFVHFYMLLCTTSTSCTCSCNVNKNSIYICKNTYILHFRCLFAWVNYKTLWFWCISLGRVKMQSFFLLSRCGFAVHLHVQIRQIRKMNFVCDGTVELWILNFQCKFIQFYHKIEHTSVEVCRYFTSTLVRKQVFYYKCM